jgi:hypothetical protein
MYAAALFIGIQNAALVQPIVAVERTVFYRERAAGMYSALPYAFGQVDYACNFSRENTNYKIYELFMKSRYIKDLCVVENSEE